jgi:hypothetical protein
LTSMVFFVCHHVSLSINNMLLIYEGIFIVSCCGKKTNEKRVAVGGRLLMFYQTSGKRGVVRMESCLNDRSLSQMFFFSSFTGATVVSWRVNNQEQLFVR